ncbi:alpha/beta hydrolase [Methylocystis bryophila]|uniref:Alpha/beta hydrolase n=1 Tax=Methylocystis bryophila TaxID=655015 RepID=A0A1W6MXU9_9HYPH|nr:alpha/beta hydrolase [Methylocystis bryophila]ARN82369.1 alpha/beta hydrolase [Methylocystis bryophila]BDV38534.1 alpha/beta hydrolase [Methylocystis bryophila]
MVSIETAAAAIGAAYGFLVLGAALFQRQLQYRPHARHTPIELSGLAGGEELRLTTSDGELLVAWHFAPEPGKPLVLYFHGAAGSLVKRVPRLRLFIESGFGVLMVSYRGYGGSSGTPTEAGLLLDADCAYRAACARYGADRLIIVGASLGAGVAVALAARREARALVLLAPFLSAMDLAARRFPFLPVRWLMRDPFRSDLAMPRVRMPVLVIHGESDPIVPIESGMRLFELANEPKTFLAVPGGGHIVLGSAGVFAKMRAWIDGVASISEPAAPPREVGSL